MPNRSLNFLVCTVFSTILGSCLPISPTSVPTAAHPILTVQVTPIPKETALSPTSTDAVRIEPTPTPQSASTPLPLERPVYQILAALDTRIRSTESGELMQLAVVENILYPNRSRDPIQELVLQFEPAWRKDLFQLLTLSADRTTRGGRAAIENGQLRIALQEPLAPGESVTLRLEYQRGMARENELIGFNDLQILLGNWYAFFPPYREGTGWLAYSPGKTGEYLNFPYADFDIQLEILGDSTYQVAASGIPEEGSSPLQFRFTGRSFAVALTKQILFPRTAGPVEVLGYARPDYTAQGNSMTDTAAQALALYSERFAEYPHRRFTVLESELPDGMEFDGLVFLSPGLFEYYTGDGKDYLTAITAHETAHQWWYARVGNDQAMDPWLDEAFATYSELLFYEKTHPDYLDWWWWIRVNRYPSVRCVDQPVYAFTTFRSYVDTVYLRGATMLNALRLRMGDQGFGDSLRELQSARFGSLVTSADVFRIFRSHSTVPLSGVWDEFLCQPPAEEA